MTVREPSMSALRQTQPNEQIGPTALRSAPYAPGRRGRPPRITLPFLVLLPMFLPYGCAQKADGLSARKPEVKDTEQRRAGGTPTLPESDQPTANRDGSIAPPEDGAETPTRQPPGSRAVTSAPPTGQQPTPRYLTVLRRGNFADDGRIDVQLDPPRTIRLETYNVTRFLITRRELPLRSGQSLALRIDGQVFEWTPRSHTLVFEHSPSSGWTVFRRMPDEP
jgi:hypothetical protein